jgi:cyclopropane fatty-acyl-phospholipid synthase-like methyltransferase
MSMMKQFSPAVERNKEPIIVQLKILFKQVKQVLEIGSGSGQHAVYFAKKMPHLIWHTSDLISNHQSINAWITESKLKNVTRAFEFDVKKGTKIDFVPDAVFTANTSHIMSYPEVKQMFLLVENFLSEGGLFCLYGPFKYNEKHTSKSNEQFEKFLKNENSQRAIRDVCLLEKLSTKLKLTKDIDMPANNRLLVFVKL